MGWFQIIVLLLIGAGAFHLLRRQLRKSRLRFIDGYVYHPSIRKRVAKTYPQLDERQLDLLFDGLRDYFAICLQAGGKPVAMPSQAVDEAWHSFLVYTREYESYCRRALGRFLHHTPVEVMSSPTIAQDGIKRAWRLACHREGINPRVPKQLPRLFAMDAALGIADGFHYVPQCKDAEGNLLGGRYCAGDIGCSSGCSGDSGAVTSDGSGGIFDGSGNGGGSDCGSGCGGGD